MEAKLIVVSEGQVRGPHQKLFKAERDYRHTAALLLQYSSTLTHYISCVFHLYILHIFLHKNYTNPIANNSNLTKGALHESLTP